MRKALLKKNILMSVSGLALAVMLMCSSNITSYASEVTVVEETTSAQTATPRSAIIEWRYKVVDGKLYRRQYNYTEQCWVGDWIYCP